MKLESENLKRAIRDEIRQVVFRIEELQGQVDRIDEKSGQLERALETLSFLEGEARKLAMGPDSRAASQNLVDPSAPLLAFDASPPRSQARPTPSLVPPRSVLPGGRKIHRVRSLKTGDRVRWLDEDFPALGLSQQAALIRRGMIGTVVRASSDVALAMFNGDLRGYLDDEAQWEVLSHSEALPGVSAGLRRPPRRTESAASSKSEAGGWKSVLRRFGLTVGAASILIGLALAMEGPAWVGLEQALAATPSGDPLVGGLLLTAGLTLLRVTRPGPRLPQLF